VECGNALENVDYRGTRMASENEASNPRRRGRKEIC